MSGELAGEELTQVIDAARHGNAEAEALLCERVYSELHQIAKRLSPSDDTSMQPTMLVNDLFVKLFRKNGLKKTANRRYFFAVAADQMRKMLIDHLRRKKRQKVGGNRQREPFHLVLDGAIREFEGQNQVDFAALDEALARLSSYNPRLYEVVMHRFFVGLTIVETAKTLGVSESSVERDWRLARAKLYADLKETGV